jgi:hypothetical protein
VERVYEVDATKTSAAIDGYYAASANAAIIPESVGS